MPPKKSNKTKSPKKVAPPSKAGSGFKKPGSKGSSSATGSASKNGGKGNNKKDKSEGKQIKVPKTIVPNFEVSDDVEINDEDIEFFKDNSDFTGFLNKMDTARLSKNEIIKAKKKTTMSALKRGPAVDSKPATADDVDSEPESGSDDDEEMEIDMDSDEEPLSEDESDDGPSYSDEESEPEELDSDDEQDYELAPRKAEGWTEKGSTRLPIKLADGRIREVAERIQPEEAGSDDEEEEEVVDSDFAEDEDESMSAFVQEEVKEVIPEKKVSKKVLLAKKKEELAQIAQAIIAEPETNVAQLKKLRTMAQDQSDVIKKLALLTQLAVYKDILPGYRIRPLTEKEQGVAVSKDVAKLRDFEQALLQNYQFYLQSLEKILAQDRPKKTEEEIKAEATAAGATEGSISTSKAAATMHQKSTPTAKEISEEEAAKKSKADLATVAIHCMCNLLTSVTHFNFRLNLMTALIARMSRRQWCSLSETCSDALKSVFKDDESGEVSMDAVKLITKMIKSKSYLVHPNVINVFLDLRLKEELPTRQGGDDENPRKRKKKEKVHISKKNRKLLKAKKEVEVEMKEAEAVVDKEEKLRMQTESLKMVFVTYFRILKHAPGSPLLPAVLEGLAKFAHLINVDFFTDLIEVLKKIMLGGSDPQAFDVYSAANRRTQLLCIVTAFQLLQGQGEALNIDLKAFYTQFYTCLMTVAMNVDVEGNIFEAADISAKEKEKQKLAAKMNWKSKKGKDAKVQEEVLVLLNTDQELIVKGFELLFFSTKGKIPPIRAASFLKRMAIISLNFPNKSVKELLALMRRLIQKQPQLDQLLTASDEDRAGNGIYHATLDDPELCNPMAASLWEFELLKTHFDPKVRMLAKQLAQFTPSAGQRTHDRILHK